MFERKIVLFQNWFESFFVRWISTFWSLLLNIKILSEEVKDFSGCLFELFFQMYVRIIFNVWIMYILVITI